MSKDPSAKYYQNDKEKLQKSSWKISKFSKEETGKKRQYGRERYKICQKMKNKSWLSTEKNIIKWGKMPCYKYKKQFSFRKKNFF